MPNLPPDAILPLIAAVAVAFVAGLLLAWLVARARRLRDAARHAAEVERSAEAQQALRETLDDARDELAGLRSRLLERERDAATAHGRLERIAPLQDELAAARADALRWREACQRAEQQATALATRLQEQGNAMREKLELLQGAREDLKQQFRQLSDEMLEERTKRLQASNTEQVGQLLNPLREQLGDFRKLVSESYEKESNARVALQTEVRQLVDLNQKLSGEANSLARALTTENRTQGYWGELRLERLLESSGLARGSEYVTQESFTDVDGDRYRPDAIVRLPEGRDVVIDAKVALNAYRESCDAPDEAGRELALARHVAAMRAHVRGLGDKDYARLEGVNAPDLVLMFVPVEAAFLEALRRDATLYEDAYARKIVIVGPGNLLASLRLIAHLWRTDQQNRNARAIAERAGKLYDKFVAFADDLVNVGVALERAQKAQQAAVARLSQGRGNLVRQAEMLRSLGVTPSKQLQPGLLDGGEDDDEDVPGESG